MSVALDRQCWRLLEDAGAVRPCLIGECPDDLRGDDRPVRRAITRTDEASGIHERHHRRDVRWRKDFDRHARRALAARRRAELRELCVAVEQEEIAVLAEGDWFPNSIREVLEVLHGTARQGN